MKAPLLQLFGSLLLWRAAADQVVWQCGSLFYADGNIYKDADALGAGLAGFAATEKFPLSLAITTHAREGPYDPILLAAPDAGSAHSYTIFNRHLYLDNRPGAFEPVGFVADNSTLAAGQTTWGFFGILGFLVWSPTGRIEDAGPRERNGNTQAVAQQGWVWRNTTTEGVARLHWSQEQFQRVVEGGDVALGAGNALGVCRSDGAPALKQAASRRAVSFTA